MFDKDPAILPASPGDAPVIREIMEESMPLLPSPDWFIDDDIPFIARHIRDEGYTLKYMDGSETAGFLMVRHPYPAGDNLGHYLSFSEEELRLVSHIESTAVRPGMRGRHIFEKLLRRAMETEKKSGYRYLLATAHPDNRYSIDTMTRCGFRPVARLVKYERFERVLLEYDHC